MQDRHEQRQGQSLGIRSNFSVLTYVCGPLMFFATSMDAFEYKFGGRAEQTSQIGFNTREIDRRRGLYPMQQYATVSGYLDLSMSFLPKKSAHVLKGGIGGMVGGVFYDSTKNLDRGSQIFNYFGYYNGYLDGNHNSIATDDDNLKDSFIRKNSRTYIWSDAFLEYQYKDYFGIKGGRYTSTMPYRSGKTQGFEVFGQYKHARLVWFSSWGRAIASGGFLINWYAPRTSYSGGYVKNAQGGWTPVGYKLSYGTHAVRLIYNQHKLLAEFFYYFSPKTFNAPGFTLGWDTNPNFDGKGFKSDTHITAIFPVYEPWMVFGSTGAVKYKYGTPITQTGQSLILRQRFDYNNFYLVGTFYKNFGNPNTYVGNMGNPAGVLLGGNSIYVGTAGTALKANAVTGAIAYGATHFNKKFTWRMQWQWTSAPVAWEGRYMLTLGYNFNQYLKATVDLAYYGVHTNKGYQAGLNNQICITYCSGGYQDRSALYTNIMVSF
ncbi:Outer membrane protein HofH [Helicobacter sp. NHP22-001]|nr:Outer membrane protein HofH [Helicobacter sp. NHP22-001]